MLRQRGWLICALVYGTLLLDAVRLAQGRPSRLRLMQATVTPDSSLATPLASLTPAATAALSTASASLSPTDSSIATAGTVTASPTGSDSPSPSETASASESDSESTSATDSNTATLIASASASASRSMPPSTTASRTGTTSGTGTASATQTVSSSSTGSCTQSSSVSWTSTMTSTASGSATSTLSPTVTGSPTGSPTVTASSTGSPTGTKTPTSSSSSTKTTSTTATFTRSATTTASETASPSKTRTVTRTQSKTPSLTPSLSETPTWTRTQSATPTPSVSFQCAVGYFRLATVQACAVAHTVSLIVEMSAEPAAYENKTITQYVDEVVYDFVHSVITGDMFQVVTVLQVGGNATNTTASASGNVTALAAVGPLDSSRSLALILSVAEHSVPLGSPISNASITAVTSNCSTGCMTCTNLTAHGCTSCSSQFVFHAATSSCADPHQAVAAASSPSTVKRALIWAGIAGSSAALLVVVCLLVKRYIAKRRSVPKPRLNYYTGAPQRLASPTTGTRTPSPVTVDTASIAEPSAATGMPATGDTPPVDFAVSLAQPPASAAEEIPRKKRGGRKGRRGGGSIGLGLRRSAFSARKGPLVSVTRAIMIEGDTLTTSDGDSHGETSGLEQDSRSGSVTSAAGDSEQPGHRHLPGTDTGVLAGSPSRSLSDSLAIAIDGHPSMPVQVLEDRLSELAPLAVANAGVGPQPGLPVRSERPSAASLSAVVARDPSSGFRYKGVFPRQYKASAKKSRRSDTGTAGLHSTMAAADRASESSDSEGGPAAAETVFASTVTVMGLPLDEAWLPRGAGNNRTGRRRRHVSHQTRNITVNSDELFPGLADDELVPDARGGRPSPASDLSADEVDVRLGSSVVLRQRASAGSLLWRPPPAPTPHMQHAGADTMGRRHSGYSKAFLYF